MFQEITEIDLHCLLFFVAGIPFMLFRNRFKLDFVDYIN
jgi:hypothetical protein